MSQWLLITDHRGGFLRRIEVNSFYSRGH